MAAKFAKEEEISYSDSNYDNTSMDTEYNNSKSRSTSPSEGIEDRVYNDISRSGGPCAPYQDQCYRCGATENLTIICFTCGCCIILCDYCVLYYYFRCPNHPQCPRQN